MNVRYCLWDSDEYFLRGFSVVSFSDNTLKNGTSRSLLSRINVALCARGMGCIVIMTYYNMKCAINASICQIEYRSVHMAPFLYAPDGSPYSEVHQKYA